MACVTGASAKSASAEATVTISVASLIPGSTPEAKQAVRRSGQAVREGQPDDQGEVGRVPVDRADVRREARRPHPADRVRGAVHRRSDARREAASSPTSPRGQGARRTSRSSTRPSSPRRRRRAARSSPCRRARTRRRSTTTGSCSAEAGLDPNKPPTTWAQVQAYAKQIAAEDGQGRLRADGRRRTTPRGWILTTRRRTPSAVGCRPASARARRRRSTTRRRSARSTCCGRCAGRTTRWAPTSTTAGATINQAFAAGNVGMYISGSDVYTNLVQASNVDPSIYGLTTIPLAKNKSDRRPGRRHAGRGPA